MIVVREDAYGVIAPIIGNPQLQSRDGHLRAPLAVILHSSWSDAARAEYGVYLAKPFSAPAGKRRVGDARFERIDDNVCKIYDVEDLPAPSASDLKEHAATKRRALVNGAALIQIESQSIPAFVDPESRGAALGLAVASQLDASLVAPWKGADGVWYSLDASEMLPFALGILAFINAAFAAEQTVGDLISAGNISAREQIDLHPWPPAYGVAS